MQFNTVKRALHFGGAIKVFNDLKKTQHQKQLKSLLLDDTKPFNQNHISNSLKLGTL